MVHTQSLRLQRKPCRKGIVADNVLLSLGYVAGLLKYSCRYNIDDGIQAQIPQQLHLHQVLVLRRRASKEQSGDTSDDEYEPC